MAKRKKDNGNGQRLATQQSVDQAVKSICDIMRRGNSAGAMQYVPELKIRKKIPLMLKHFEDFLRLLPSRGDSQLSWTVDMDARKQSAAEQARPLKEHATAKGQQAAQWSQRVADLKKAKPRDDQTIEDAEAKVKELTRESRDLAGKAKEIEDAVYDLKAVNPNKKPNVDTRTPEELMNIIEAKGKEVAAALATLRGNKNSV